MSLPSLWCTVEPELGFTRVLLSEAGRGTLLKAKLSARPMRPGALAMMLESFAAWEGKPLFAVLDAEGPGVHAEPEHWAKLLGEAALRPSIHAQWASPAPSRLRQESFFTEMGNFTKARRLLVRAATGQR